MADETAYDWEGAVETFLRERRRTNCSPATLATYRACLLGDRTATWRQRRGIASPEGLERDALRDFEASMFEEGLTAATVATYHRIVKNFARFCIEEGWALEARVLTMPGPRLPQEAPDTYTRAEQEGIRAACRLPRDRVIVDTLLYTGLRLKELCALKVTDVVEGPQGAWLRVRQGKGRKDRGVPLDSAAWNGSKALRRYVLTIRPRDTACQAMFLSSRRNRSTGDYTPLAAQSVKVLLRRIGEATGLHVHAHKFRHTFATEALISGVDPLALQRVLGHTTLAMTNRYVHHRTDDLVEVWRQRAGAKPTHAMSPA